MKQFEGASDRICRMRIIGIFRNLSLINVHAPSEIKDADIKTKFYEDLDRLIGSIPRFDSNDNGNRLI